MTVQDFYKIVEATNAFCEVFGATDEFKAGYTKHWGKIRKAICKDEHEGVTDLAFVFPGRDLKPRTESLVRGFKKWIADNYRFPKQ